MEFVCFIFAIAGFAFFGWLLSRLNAPAGKGGSQSSRASAGQSFQAWVSVGTERFDGRSFKVFSVSIRGRVRAPCGNYPIRYRCSVSDVTSAEDGPLPVLCVIPELQGSDGVSLAYVSDITTLPYAESVMERWVDFLSIPIEALVFAKRGKRDLQFRVQVAGAKIATVLVEAKFNLSYENPEIGYIDGQEAEKRVEELAAKLAVGVSAADSALDKSEGQVVRAWIRDRMASAPPGKEEETKNRLNRAVREALGTVKAGKTINSAAICEKIVDLAPLGRRYEILELCLRVVSADGTAREREMNVVANLAELLDVDRDRFRAMSEKAVPVGMHEVQDEEQLLGIDSNMTRQEARAHLRKEYRKWNSRVTHSDPAVREQADQMIELISKARARLESSERNESEHTVASGRRAVLTDHICPQCGNALVIRSGRNGRFLGCSTYPKCRYTEDMPSDLLATQNCAIVEDAGTCPECGAGLVKRWSRGRSFYRCSTFPDCHYIRPAED